MDILLIYTILKPVTRYLWKLRSEMKVREASKDAT